MATARQVILRPILHDGLLTAECGVWKRSNKATAPVLTTRHILGFAKPMLAFKIDFVKCYDDISGILDVVHDMAMLT